MQASGSTKRGIRTLAFYLFGGGFVAFAIGMLLDGPSGDRPGIYFGQAGIALFAIGIVALIVLFVISVSSQ